ncbi:hypothetical protein ACJIZ3_015714 [Penstemon smallii]|uniref:Uncharacterized protein n=1 Tax=Penstemon smallii TaxID=265156 RepID=A0ABD3RR71_9LAMI
MRSLLIQRRNLRTVARHLAPGHLKSIRPVLKEFKVMNLGISIVRDNTLIIGAVLTNVLRRSYFLILNNRTRHDWYASPGLSSMVFQNQVIQFCCLLLCYKLIVLVQNSLAT